MFRVYHVPAFIEQVWVQEHTNMWKHWPIHLISILAPFQHTHRLLPVRLSAPRSPSWIDFHPEISTRDLRTTSAFEWRCLYQWARSYSQCGIDQQLIPKASIVIVAFPIPSNVTDSKLYMVQQIQYRNWRNSIHHGDPSFVLLAADQTQSSTWILKHSRCNIIRISSEFDRHRRDSHSWVGSFPVPPEVTSYSPS